MRRSAFLIASAPLLTFALMSPASAKREPGAMTEKGVLTLYEGQNFEGESIEIKKDLPSISYDFTIGSIGIYPGEKWELCEQSRFRGVCNVMTANETKLGKIKIQSARMVKPPVATVPVPAK
jgi:Beta/Gamma crystallin